MNEKRAVSRRRFLGAAAGALAAPYVVPSSVLGLGGAAPPSDRIVMGVIGLGGMGSGNARAFMGQKDCQVVAVCDVDVKHLEEAAANVNKHYANNDCKKYSDFRELLARADIDAVVVATPDHWHALCAIAAVRAKKDVYCEKPVTHTFAEGQALVAAVKQHGRILQVGSQQRSEWGFRRAVELVTNGKIGKVKRVEVGLPTGHKKAEGDTKPQDPPPHVDYDFWCGPSPKLAYVPARLHWNWRWHLSYGGGQLMDWIGHHNDIAHWGLGRDESGPIEVKAAGFEYPEDRTVWNSAWNYEVLCTFDDGVTSSISNRHPMGCKWIGEAGWVHVDRGRLEASDPAWVKKEHDPGPKKAYESNDHRGNFLACVRSRKPTICPAEVAHRSITPGHLGLLSESLGGRAIRWDPKEERVIGDSEAEKRLKSVDFRKPWALS
ncbi:MAG: Gfo/Idh/MocA family oxidoreductase [Planctomycetes bacterium]|nr:Gfo/Idh/MocA family oxidoreductase [Planctomycetota bacterium]